MKIGTQGAPVHKVFALEELEEATDNFNKSMFLGGGSLGEVPLHYPLEHEFYWI